MSEDEQVTGTGGPAVVERLKTLRERAAIVVLFALVVRLLLGLAEFGYSWTVGSDGGTGLGDVRFPVSASTLVYSATDVLTVVVAALLVASCVLRDPTPHARALTWGAVAVTAVGIVLSLVAVVGWAVTAPPGGGGWTAARSLLGLPVPVLVLIGLVILLWEQPKPALGGARRDRTGAAAAIDSPEEPENARRSADVVEEDQAEAEDDANAPTWSPDQAAGAVWLTAGDAAAGAAASRWGMPGDETGWRPPADEPQEPPSRDATPELEQRPRP